MIYTESEMENASVRKAFFQRGETDYYGQDGLAS